MNKNPRNSWSSVPVPAHSSWSCFLFFFFFFSFFGSAEVTSLPTVVVGAVDRLRGCSAIVFRGCTGSARLLSCSANTATVPAFWGQRSGRCWALGSRRPAAPVGHCDVASLVTVASREHESVAAATRQVPELRYQQHHAPGRRTGERCPACRTVRLYRVSTSSAVSRDVHFILCTHVYSNTLTSRAHCTTSTYVL